MENSFHGLNPVRIRGCEEDPNPQALPRLGWF
jgi:hypothetical protein